MKYILLFFILFSCVVNMSRGQAKSPPDNVVITSDKGKTRVQTNGNGELIINVAPEDILRFKAKGLVSYSDFGAKGDGKNIRFGANQNNGSSQRDIFIVDKDGNVDMSAPIIWDFDQITDITALPIDETTLTITGGRFTTINRAESKYTYYSRGIAIRRSNVLVNGLEHRITGEGDHGAPYGGFINVGDCAYVTVRNTILTGHKTYQTIGAAGVSVSMGSYDLSLNRALNVSLVNCSQTNDINDSSLFFASR